MIKLFKSDNPILKAEPGGRRVCIFCDSSAVDNARHMILQCDDTQEEREEMFQKIYTVLDRETNSLNDVTDMFATLMGRGGMTEKLMYRFLTSRPDVCQCLVV